MKVLIVSQYFWPETFRITEVAQSLRDEGCEVTVLTGQPNYPDGKVFKGYRAWGLGQGQGQGQSAFGTVLRVPLVPRGRSGAVRLALNYLSFVVSAALLGPWLLRRQHFDAVLVYAPSPILQAIPAMWLAWLKSAPLVTWVQDLWPESLAVTGFVRRQRFLAWVAAVVRWIYRHNDLLLVQSQGFLDPVRALSGGTPVSYHPNPGEAAFSEPPSAHAPALALEPGFNVVFAGNLGTVQALDTVVAAAQLLRDDPDVRFVLVGSGSRSNWLTQEVQRLGLGNIRMPGRFSPAQMPGILAQASALLVSLRRDPAMAQTIPSKIPAYLAAGRPIIAALDGEGARVVVEAGAGVACAAESAQAMANAVRQLKAMEPAECEQMGARGRQHYEAHFEPRALAGQLRGHLERAAQAHGEQRIRRAG